MFLLRVLGRSLDERFKGLCGELFFSNVLGFFHSRIAGRPAGRV